MSGDGHTNETRELNLDAFPCECDHSHASHRRGPCEPDRYRCGKSCQRYVLPPCRLGVEEYDYHRHCFAHGGTVELGEAHICDRVRPVRVLR